MAADSRRLVLVLLLLTVVLAGGAYWLLIGRIHHLDVYRTAMETIRADKELQQELGEPMHSVKWPLRAAVPSARIEDREIDIRWAIQGPRARGDAHVHAKRMLGKWETDILEVKVNGKILSPRMAGDSEAERAGVSVWQCSKEARSQEAGGQHARPGSQYRSSARRAAEQVRRRRSLAESLPVGKAHPLQRVGLW